MTSHPSQRVAVPLFPSKELECPSVEYRVLAWGQHRRSSIPAAADDHPSPIRRAHPLFIGVSCRRRVFDQVSDDRDAGSSGYRIRGGASKQDAKRETAHDGEHATVDSGLDFGIRSTYATESYPWRADPLPPRATESESARPCGAAGREPGDRGALGDGCAFAVAGAHARPCVCVRNHARRSGGRRIKNSLAPAIRFTYIRKVPKTSHSFDDSTRTDMRASEVLAASERELAALRTESQLRGLAGRLSSRQARALMDALAARLRLAVAG